jgi:hypothetical protein
MAGKDKSREAHLRKMAARQGLVLTKSQEPADGDIAGGYMLLDSASRAVAVSGAKSGRGPLDVSGKGYQATLDEIEAYLRRGDN